jgi:GNAT superfamily N-acetyltransferase/ADP-ribose pyrophosphatase YjhB (NUDIX family)
MEQHPHVTVLFGLVDDSSLEPIREHCATLPPIEFTIGNISAFRNEEHPHDVLKLEVVSPQMEELHYWIRENFKNECKFDFNGHMTMAYIEKGTCADLEGPCEWTGAKYVCNKLVFSHKDNGLIEMPLGGENEAVALLSHLVEGKSSDLYYHLTDKPKFKLDPNYAPEDNAIAIEDRSGRKGIYLATDVERWVNGHGYWRPFVVEIKVDPSVKENASGRYGGEMFVPAELFDKLNIERVIPLDAYAREHFGAHGWIEEELRKEFDTGKPIDDQERYPFHGYRYAGPDVRQMSVDATKRLARDLKKVKGSVATSSSKDFVEKVLRQIAPKYKVKVKLTGEENEVWIESLTALERGDGKKFMAELVELADMEKQELWVNAQPIGSKTLSKEELVRWYEGFGFEVRTDHEGGYAEMRRTTSSLVESKQDTNLFNKWFKLHGDSEGLRIQLHLDPYDGPQVTKEEALVWFNRRLAQVKRTMQVTPQGVRAWRCLKVTKDWIEDLKTGKVQKLGEHWTLSEDLVPWLCGGTGGKQTDDNVILEALIPTDQINIVDAMNPNWADDAGEEFEVNPKTVQLLKVWDSGLKKVLHDFGAGKKMKASQETTSSARIITPEESDFVEQTKKTVNGIEFKQGTGVFFDDEDKPLFIFAFKQNKLVASLVYDLSHKAVYIRDMHVLPAFRNQKLMSTMVRWAQELHGKKEVDWNSLTDDGQKFIDKYSAAHVAEATAIPSQKTVMDLMHRRYRDSYWDLYPNFSREMPKDEEGYPKEDTAFSDKHAALQEARDIIDMFKAMPDPIPVYRTVHAKSIDDVDLTNAGYSWSWSEKSAISFALHGSLPKPIFMLKGFAPKNKVNWHATIELYYTYSGASDWESENEIRIAGKDVKNITVEPLKKKHMTARTVPYDQLPEGELKEFYNLCRREEWEEEYRESAEYEWDKMSETEQRAEYDRLKAEGYSDLDPKYWKKFKPNEQLDILKGYYISEYIRYAEENAGVSTETFFSDPVVGRNVTLVRFLPIPPEKILTEGFGAGYGPTHLGLTVHYAPRKDGELLFAFTKKDIAKENMESLAGKYGQYAYEFKVPWAVRAYHQTDDEHQTVFESSEAKDIKLIWPKPKKTKSDFEDEGFVGDYWGSQGSGILFTCKGKMLLMERAHWVEQPYTWGIPGGAVPVDENDKSMDPKKSAIKEVTEEIGSFPANAKWVDQTVFKDGSFQYTTYIVEVPSEFTPRLNDEHTDFMWVDPSNIPQDMEVHFGVQWTLKNKAQASVKSTHPILTSSKKEYIEPCPEYPQTLNHTPNLPSLPSTWKKTTKILSNEKNIGLSSLAVKATTPNNSHPLKKPLEIEDRRQLLQSIKEKNLKDQILKFINDREAAVRLLNSSDHGDGILDRYVVSLESCFLVVSAGRPSPWLSSDSSDYTVALLDEVWLHGGKQPIYSYTTDARTLKTDKGLEFTVTLKSWNGPKEPDPKSDDFNLEAYVGSKKIAYLYCYHEGARLYAFEVQVNEAYQRKGVATALYNYAQDISGKHIYPHHLSSGNEQPETTDDAVAFWKKRGIDLTESSHVEAAKNYGDLYHMTPVGNLFYLAKENFKFYSSRKAGHGLKGKEKEDFPYEGKYFVSLTRDPRLLFNAGWSDEDKTDFNCNARIVIDGAKLSQRHKVFPFSDLEDPSKSGRVSLNESEEAVLIPSGHTINLSAYVKRVDIYDDPSIPEYNKKWIPQATAELDKRGIPWKMVPKFYSKTKRIASSKDMSTATFISAIDEVADEYHFAFPENAYWQCTDFSKAIFEFGQWAGIPVEMWSAQVKFQQDLKEVNAGDVVGHTFVKIDGTYYDWTARQANPHAKFPEKSKSPLYQNAKRMTFTDAGDPAGWTFWFNLLTEKLKESQSGT